MLLLAQLNRELSTGDQSLHTASLNLEIRPGIPAVSFLVWNDFSSRI